MKSNTRTSGINSRRVAATVALAGALIAGALPSTAIAVADNATGTAIGDDFRGPYVNHLDCVERGDQGILNGEWWDFECQGPYAGPWMLVPR
ncbi:hypothetical protein [Nocardia sp. NPDC049149]|uniref:hypothetical protein n=1 Tax=Nocardia sp. NPDC049149 TaxID=3364315 RepID=UPI0037169AD1